MNRSKQIWDIIWKHNGQDLVIIKQKVERESGVEKDFSISEIRNTESLPDHVVYVRRSTEGIFTEP